MGRRRVETVQAAYFDYDHERLDEGRVVSLDSCVHLLESPSVTWINVWGLHDVDFIRSLTEHAHLHRLIVEDILDTRQRAKAEEYEEAAYMVLRMLSHDPASEKLEDEQLSLVLGPNYVLSFQERPGDVFEPIRERLRTGRGIIRTRGPDYLAYALMDTVVDRYFGVLEELGERIGRIEAHVLEGAPTRGGLPAIQHLRREALVVRRAVWPLRDVLGSLQRGDSRSISEETRVFLRDVHDHAVHVIDTVETLRELAAGVMDLHMSVTSNRMNEVMKVLTIITTIFIPLSFLAGLYGMNFDNMPELHVPWAYPALLAVMGLLCIGMLTYFKRRGWW